MRKSGAAPTLVGTLYAEHSGRVLRWVLRFYPRGEAEEVVHEICTKAGLSQDETYKLVRGNAIRAFDLGRFGIHE